MAASTLSGLILCLLVATAVANEYKFEFGHRPGGQSMGEKNGVIPLLSYSNDVTLNVPEGMRTTYVSVTVNALAPPHVSYDFDTNTVSINYSYLEITASKYKINYKGIHIGREHQWKPTKNVPLYYN